MAENPPYFCAFIESERVQEMFALYVRQSVHQLLDSSKGPTSTEYADIARILSGLESFKKSQEKLSQLGNSGHPISDRQVAS